MTRLDDDRRMPRHGFLSSEFEKKFQREVPLMLYAHGLVAAVLKSQRREIYKKLCHRRRTARRAVSQNILNCCVHFCRNKLYNKSRTDRSTGVRGLQSTDV